jgi:hypothetical protein
VPVGIGGADLHPSHHREKHPHQAAVSLRSTPSRSHSLRMMKRRGRVVPVVALVGQTSIHLITEKFSPRRCILFSFLSSFFSFPFPLSFPSFFTHTHTRTITHTPSLTHPHSHTLTHTPSLTHPHSHTLTHTPSLTHPHLHSFRMNETRGWWH